MKHKFVAGQIVELAPNALLVAAAGMYEILRRLPLSDVSADSPRYRIKSPTESHERVARETELTLSVSPGVDNSYID